MLFWKDKMLMRSFIYKRFEHIFVDLQRLAQALLLPLVFVQMIIILEVYLLGG